VRIVSGRIAGCRRHAAAVITLSLLGASFGNVAHAQSDGQGEALRTREIGVVITTARKKKETMQTVPVAAFGVSRETLEQNNLIDLQKIATSVPNLAISRGVSGNGPSLHIRGVGTDSSSAGFDPAVGIVIDGVSFNRGRWVQQGFLDLAQVEVLKGPQALYFGKNVSAGLVSITTADPGDEFEAYIRAGYEIEAREILTEAVVSVPISDTFGVRLALRYDDTDGWVKNVAKPIVGEDPLGFVIPGSLNRRLPNEKDYNGRVTFLWTPSDELQARLKIGAVRNTDSSRYSTLQQVRCYGPNGNPQPIFGVNSDSDDCKLNFFMANSDLPHELMSGEPDEFVKNGGEQWSEYESFYTSLQLDYTGQQFSITSITAYWWYDNQYMGQSEFSGQGQVGVYENARFGTFSQELRGLTTFDGPVNFLGGLYYQDTDFSFRNSARIAAVPADPATGRYWSYDKISTTKGKTYSAFGELTWNISDQLELAGGARYTRESKDSDLESTYVHALLAGFLAERDLENKFKDENVSPQVTLTYRPNGDLTFYGAYREGFKSGGFDNSFLLTNATAEDADITFESETSSGFEVGAKTMLFDGTVRLNATAYRYTFKNLQVQELDTETTQFKIRNAGKARTTGVEVDFDWLATDSLTINGSVAYNDGHYVDFLVGCWSGQSIEEGCNQTLNPATGRFTAQDRSGGKLIKAPKWTLNLGFNYDFLIANGLRGALSADVMWKDDHLLDEKNTPGTEQGAYALLNAGLRIMDDEENWEFAIIGRNLTNKAYAWTGLGRPLTGGSSGLPMGTAGQTRSDVTAGVARGREVMFRVTYRFH
jgi:outer membrane receptor protein involved in Fe transport